MTLPVWQQIRETLTAEIAGGRFAPGAKLPTEAALSARFGVNRHTVRRALAAMQDEGLVTARRGAGVFVTGGAVAYRLGRRTRFTRNLAQAGHSGDRTILRLERAPATAREASALEIGRGAPVLTLETVARIDGVPAMQNLSLFPAAGLDAFADAMRATGSITEGLRACAIDDYRRDWTRITAERAPGLVARHLQIPEGAPVMRVTSLNRTPAGRAIEHARTYFSADRVELLVDEESFA